MESSRYHEAKVEHRNSRSRVRSGEVRGLRNFINNPDIILTMTLDEQIENLQYQVEKIDGKKWKYNLGNRAQGLGHTTIGAFFALKVPIAGPIIGSILFIDGIGDLIIGKHHYLIYRILKIHPKYKLEKLTKNSAPASD